MIRSLVAVIVLASITPAGLHSTYEAAKASSEISKKPLIVVVGASWCAPCKKMKGEIKANASSFTYANLVIVDYKSKGGRELYKGSSVPAIIKFKWNGSKWVKTIRTGYQSQRNLKRWILE